MKKTDISRYLAFCKIENNSPKTINLKEKILKYLSDFLNKPYKKATRKDLEDFFYSKSDLKTGTLNLYKVNIKSFYSWLYEKNNGDYPKVVEWIRPAKNKDQKDITILTKTEIEKLIQNTTNTRDRAIISILYDAGLRASELADLKRNDILSDEHGFRIQVNGKTGRRKIRLVSSVPVLRQWLNEHPIKNDTAPLFICLARKYGQPLYGHGIGHIVRKTAIKSKIKKNIHPHIFRHSRATHLSAEGFSEPELRTFHGWSKTSRMPFRYTHTSEDDVDRKIRGKNGMSDKEDIKEGEALKPVICPSCKEMNEAQNLYCSKCFKILKDSALKFDTTYQLEKKIKKFKEEIEKIKENLGGSEMFKKFTQIDEEHIKERVRKEIKELIEEGLISNEILARQNF